MKDKILEYLKTDRSFDNGKALYNQCSNRSKRVINELNVRNNTPRNLEYLHYNLFLLTGLNGRLFTSIMQKPVMQLVKTTAPSGPTEKEVFEAKLSAAISIEDVNNLLKGNTNNELIALATAKIQELTPPPAPENTTTKETIVKDLQADKKASQGLKLRQQFPFLSKDDCPDWAKILVNDLITSYEKFLAAHPKLHEQVPEAELLQQTKDVVVPYKENKAIWAELEHYQSKGEALGEHPVFKQLEKDAKLKSMNNNELADRKKTVEGYIRKYESQHKTAKANNNTKKIKSTTEKVEEYTKELEQITELLKK